MLFIKHKISAFLILYNTFFIYATNSYIWLYTSGEYEEHQIVVYEYQPSRGGCHAAEFLGVITDLYIQMDSVGITA